MSKDPRFEIHYNRALGKKYYTERDMRKDMDKGGYVFSNSPDAVAKSYPKREYKPSKEAHEIINEVKRSTDKHGNVHLGSVARDWINANMKATPDLSHLKNKTKGGWS